MTFLWIIGIFSAIVLYFWGVYLALNIYGTPNNKILRFLTLLLILSSLIGCLIWLIGIGLLSLYYNFTEWWTGKTDYDDFGED